MKTVIELARKVGLLDGTLPVPQTVERFATLVKAAHTAELVAGVEMPEAFGSAEVFSGHNAHGLPEYAYVDAYTADQLRETVAAAVLRKDMLIEEWSKKAVTHFRLAAEFGKERDALKAQLDDYTRMMTDRETALKAENERLRAESKPNCRECTQWVKEHADNREWIEGVQRGREICEQLVAAKKGHV